MPDTQQIHNTLEKLGEALMMALSYKKYPVEKIEEAIKAVDEISTNPAYQKQLEEHLNSSNNYVLFYISNVIYNLKAKNEMKLTPESIKWLCSVWINFLKRNLHYQKAFPVLDRYRIELKKHYPGDTNFVQQLENVGIVKEEFAKNTEDENSPLNRLQKFHNTVSEILKWMRPTYFFLLDFYYERKLKAGEDYPDGMLLEQKGIAKFGHLGFTYGDILLANSQALGIIEAVYLILKKRKTSRKFIIIDGKQKFMTIPEIYLFYLDKFNAAKKELREIRE